MTKGITLASLFFLEQCIRKLFWSGAICDLLQHSTLICALCATVQFMNWARGWRLKHTKTYRQRHESSLKQECPKNAPFIVSRGSLYRDSHAPPQTITLPSETPEGLVLRAAVGTQIKRKQVVYKKFRIWGYTAPNNLSWYKYFTPSSISRLNFPCSNFHYR